MSKVDGAGDVRDGSHGGARGAGRRSRRGRDPRRDRERLARFRLVDDTFMRAAFRDQLPLAQHVLRKLTGIASLTLAESETQRDLTRATGSRGVVLDVYGVDEKGNRYDLEIQTGSNLNPRRFRYYGSAMDVDSLPAGAPYDSLPERWLVVLLERDPEGPGRPIRHYRASALDGSGVLEDGAHLLYVNASYRGEDEMGSLMMDFCQSDPQLISDNLLRERVQYLKTNDEGVLEMCRISDEIRAEGREEGRAEGREEGREETRLADLRSVIANLGVSVQEALRALNVPENERGYYESLLDEC